MVEYKVILCKVQQWSLAEDERDFELVKGTKQNELALIFICIEVERVLTIATYKSLKPYALLYWLISDL